MNFLSVSYTHLDVYKRQMFYRYYINDFDFFTADSQSNWVAVDRSTNEVVDTVLTDQYKEFCTLMAKWAEAGYISEDEVTKTTTDTTTQTQDWGISWWTDIPVNAEANSRYNQEVVMTPIDVYKRQYLASQPPSTASVKPFT